MQWLSPWAWLGLGLLALPVLVHLFSRRPARTVAFPSLRFLNATPLRPTRRTRISDWPLLLVRLLTLAAAVVALAQPTRRSALSVAEGAGTTVQVIDTSRVVFAADSVRVGGARASMGAGADTGQVMIVPTADLNAGVAMAVAMLRHAPPPRRVAITSTFVDGAMDSLTLRAIPRDVALTLNLGTPRGAVMRRDSVGWTSTLSSSEQAAVVQAAEMLGGAQVRPAGLVSVTMAAGLPRATSDTAVRASAFSPMAVVVMQRVAADGSVREQFGSAVVDSSLASTVSDATSNATGAVVLVRRAGGQPAVVATPLGRGVQITGIGQETPARALALLLAAGGVNAPVTTGAPLPQATRDVWSRLPAAPAIGAGDVPVDLHAVTTDARWWWVLVLVLLLVEWRMRKRVAARHEESLASGASPREGTPA